ncbi:MAG: gamma-glutamyltransferase [Oscillospiraceae bacterium]|nr:gamma-glutamyltransferase [Oscillospiraceae bacterium]
MKNSFSKRAFCAALALSMLLTGLSVTACAAEPVYPEVVSEGKDAYGYTGMVSAADPQAAQIGLEVLKAGGNAADAIVATAFALGLTEPAASGIGGSGLAIYYDAASDKVTSFNYYHELPHGMDLENFRDPAADLENGKSGKQVPVPGTVAGLCKINELVGSMPLAEVLAPAIKLAEEGCEVSSFMEVTYMDSFYKLMQYDETLRVYTYDGIPYMAGDIFTNPDYAKTLRMIAENGVDAFYKGEVAKALVDTVRQAGGHLSLQDLNDYDVVVSEPVRGTYRGYEVYSVPPTSGGAMIIHMLNMAEKYNIGNMEYGSAKYVHTWAEIMRLAMSDYTRAILDPEFYPQDRVNGLLTKAYARARANKISANKVLGENVNGEPYLFAPKIDKDSHTTHLTVVDKDGNMASMTNTLGDFFGSYLTCKDYGFLINNTKAFTVNTITEKPEAGKKGRSPMSPYLVFTPEGKQFLAGGTPGSTRIMGTNALVISHMIDGGVDVQTALNRPRVFKNSTGNLHIEGGLDMAINNDLIKIGHKITEHPENDSYFGGVHAISIDPETGLLHGAADPRRSGQAFGY